MVASDLKKKWFDWNLKESTISKGKRVFSISLVIKFKQQRAAIYIYYALLTREITLIGVNYHLSN